MTALKNQLYRGRLFSTGYHCLSITDVSHETFAMIDGIAEANDMSRTKVARMLLDGLIGRPETVADIMGAEQPKPKPKRTAHLYAVSNRKLPSVPQLVERAQDAVCRDLHGSIPAGGCRYPNCGCKV